MNLQENIRRILREENEERTSKTIKGLLQSSLEKNERFCGFDIITPSENEDRFYQVTSKSPYKIKLYFIGGPNSKYWPRTQAVFMQELSFEDEVRNIVKSFMGMEVSTEITYVNSCEGYEWLMNRKYGTNDIHESIVRPLNEETEGIESFIDTINSKYETSDELVQFLTDFIKNSNCKKIEFADFKMGAMGIALHDGVLINKSALNMGLEFLLFLIFHEVAHQYQFKKYGEDVMYACYIGDISIDEAAKFMKNTEEVADEFAARKIKELQKKGLIDTGFRSPQMYKNVPINTIKGMIGSYRNQMMSRNINSPEKISEFFYNMVKKEL